MLKSRSLLLILVCLALGALVWFDNQQASGPGSQSSASSIRSHPPASERASQDHETPVPETDTDAGAAGARQLGNPLAFFDKAKLKDTVERPLFASSRRRPPAVEVVERPVGQVGPKPQPLSYDLLGVVRRGDRAIAVLRKKSDRTSFRVEVGDMIGGWRVSKMDPTSVLLEREDGTSQTVPLF